jgi:hypothetical protein
LGLLAAHADIAHLHLHLEVRGAAIGQFGLAGEVVTSVEIIIIEGPVIFKRPGRYDPQVFLVEVLLVVLRLLAW